ncbi:MAG: hypothetical protein AAF799_03840 [Myxococcota bacterium]
MTDYSTSLSDLEVKCTVGSSTLTITCTSTIRNDSTGKDVSDVDLGASDKITDGCSGGVCTIGINTTKSTSGYSYKMQHRKTANDSWTDGNQFSGGETNANATQEHWRIVATKNGSNSSLYSDPIIRVYKSVATGSL